MEKVKRAGTGKGRKTKAKMNEAVEVVEVPESEDADIEVNIDVGSKAARGRKRKSVETADPSTSAIEVQPPPPKRRATRTRASTAVEDKLINPDETVNTPDLERALKPDARKRGRPSAARSTRKASAASVAALRAAIPNDDEIDAVLEADLERPLTDDEDKLIAPPNRAGRASKIMKADHAMFSTEPMDVDEAVIESELQAIVAESKPLPKAKGAKVRQPRKVSAKQQAAARKAAEAEAASGAERLAEEEASEQIAVEPEHNLSIHDSLPIVQPKRQRASSRQPSRQLLRRSTRPSVLSVNESNISMVDNFQDGVDDHKDDSGNETDASMISQSTAARGGSNLRGRTTKKGKGGKKAISRNIEEIVHKPQHIAIDETAQEFAGPLVEKEPAPVEELLSPDERYYTPAPEAPNPVMEESAPLATKPKAAAKRRGRPSKAAPASTTQEPPTETEPVQTEPPHLKTKTVQGTTTPMQSRTPPAKKSKPTESPQSSDAENHPPSKPSAGTKKSATPHSTTTRIPLAASTPIMSPAKRNVIAGLQSAHPWSAVELDALFLELPSDENDGLGILREAMHKAKNGDLTSPEKKMTVEEWIHYNAEMAEEKLRNECEGMVGRFEMEGGRAMRALEGVECVE